MWTEKFEKCLFQFVSRFSFMTFALSGGITSNKNFHLIALRELIELVTIFVNFFLFSIYPSSQPPGQQIPIGNNTGSLPDLSNVHFPSPLHTPLDQEDHSSSTPFSNVSCSTDYRTSTMIIFSLFFFLDIIRTFREAARFWTSLNRFTATFHFFKYFLFSHLSLILRKNVCKMVFKIIEL